ncbi:MAG TPA: glycoside hydrolase family 38 C-terminal domain-containing protein [Clostridiales bacterium]|nr:glycoside hydrolase family 38 C-terminal domain-containing protein [Clostridiales bacterium]
MRRTTPKAAIYTVATTHLDTSWNWELETTLKDYLPKTLTENFALFEKHPGYVFSFEGACRYELMEEYYPELFEKLREYIAAGRWNVAGSAYENGDVNIPSPEALIRNILYGQAYFREKFGKTSADVYLPDCFGFGWALPSAAAHCGLKGFTTQKLVWSSAAGVPFDLGIWRGPDGAEIFASLDARDYNATLRKVRTNGRIVRKLKANIRQYGLPMTMVLHGVGDRGGAPREASVQTVLREAEQNGREKIDVIAASTDRIFKDLERLPAALKQRLPVYNGELVMTDHGAGAYTSRAPSKRFNRRAEQLGAAAEQASAFARLLGSGEYPSGRLDAAWKRVIAHQFHDDITGTSLAKCYRRNWNDLLMSLNEFASIYEEAAGNIAAAMDTSFAAGRALLVHNPAQPPRRCCAEALADPPAQGKYLRVYDSAGSEVPSQTHDAGGGKVRLVFEAELPGCGCAVYDLREESAPCALESAVRAGERSLENGRYRVSLDGSGDIAEIFDKKIGRQLLGAPLRMALFDYDGCMTYPAWELEYRELKKRPAAFAADPVFTVRENGPARAVIETRRTARGSVFIQRVSLDAQGDCVEVFNEIEWRSPRTLLKAVFPLAARCKTASYDLGLGVIKRGNSRKKLYEVPAQMWADITDEGGGFGVSVISDSKCGWDKPADGTLRLTVIHSPRAPYRDAQHLLDFGLNRFGFALYGHEGDWTGGTQTQAACFHNKPAVFEVPKSAGGRPPVFSMLQAGGEVLVRAVKQSLGGGETIVRVNEAAGRAHKRTELAFFDPVSRAREVSGTENDKGPAAVENRRLVFALRPFEVKTFALTFVDEKQATPPASRPLDLPCNVRVVTPNAEPGGFTPGYGPAIPAERFPAEIRQAGAVLNTAPPGDGFNALACCGQTLQIPGGAKRLCLVCASYGGDKTAALRTDGGEMAFEAPGVFERPGAWDLYGEGETGRIKKQPLAFHTTHAHGETGDEFGRQLFWFLADIPLPEGCAQAVLPDDKSVVLLAASAVFEPKRAVCLSELYDSLEKRPFDFALTPEQQEAAKATKFGHFRSRAKFLLAYAGNRLRREAAQLR